MKPKDIMDALNEIDDDMVEDAAPKDRKRQWVRWAAACLALVIVGGAAAFFLGREETHTVSLGGVTREYSGSAVTQETALIFPWEYETADERYTGMIFNGLQYRGRCKQISESLLGETLGSCLASGYDIYTDQSYEETFAVRKIAGVEQELLVAVKLDNSYYVFVEESYDEDLTLGAFFEGLNLRDALSLNRFTEYSGYTAGQTRQLQEGADDAIWELLFSCRDAELLAEQDGFATSDKEYISFTATAEKLGIYKKVFCVTRDGYVETNIMDWSYAWFIGEENAWRIIDYALEHGEPAEQEPYYYTLVGTVTEIRDGDFLVNDGVLMADPDDGMIFRVSTEDIRISRWLDFGGIGVGDLVAVHYTGGIDTENQNTLLGALDISEAIFADGEAMIPE